MSRFRSILWQGAASALLIGEPAIADQVDEAHRPPHWVVRAQQRMALKGSQQRALRTLVDDNALKMQSLPSQRSHEDVEILRGEFRAGLAQILHPRQIAAWDLLLEELLGAVHLRNAPVPGDRH
ncbi:MAG TPA: hypothetical protein VJP84_07440 [Steroidobacteraceae bacterium]|nr:hypothetical protein [Steroidobacteraceae bacterium]